MIPTPTPDPFAPGIFLLAPGTDAPPEVIGAKAYGLITLMRLGLPVPAGFVIGVGPPPPDDLVEAAARELRAEAVSVRSGAAVSMPGMMNTVLDVRGPIAPTVHEVRNSWNTPRAVTYRELHGIPHTLGTAVIVQTMVFGNREPHSGSCVALSRDPSHGSPAGAHSGSGVAFSRDPANGTPAPWGDVLPGHRGDAVVSGAYDTLPLTALPDPVRADLVAALNRLEAHYRDACHVEFTYENGHLWLLQVRPGGLTPRAAVRVAVDLADEGLISRQEAVRRVTAHQLKAAVTPRMLPTDVLTRGRPASPGVATGCVARTADSAVRMPGPAILVRPTTSPLDMHGLAAATGIVTAHGGPASHAAVVARAMAKPAVVGAGALNNLTEGTLITIDGSSGEIALGAVGTTPGEADPHLRRLLKWAATTL